MEFSKGQLVTEPVIQGDPQSRPQSSQAAACSWKASSLKDWPVTEAAGVLVQVESGHLSMLVWVTRVIPKDLVGCRLCVRLQC